MKNNNLNKNFKNKIKEYEKNKISYAKYLKEEYMDGNYHAVIKLNLKDQEIYNPMSMDQQKDLNNDIYDFLDQKVYPLPSIVPVIIEIHGIKDENEQEKIKAIIKEHYDLELKDRNVDLKLNSLKAIMLFIFGSILLGLYFLLDNIISNLVWYEILSIVSTFIIWEAADLFFLERRHYKSAYNDTAQMVLSEIKFIND